MVRCKDGSLYTGITNNIEERINTHNAGKGAKYTRARKPVELVYSEGCCDRSHASKRELHIKGLSKSQKETLIKNI